MTGNPFYDKVQEAGGSVKAVAADAGALYVLKLPSNYPLEQAERFRLGWDDMWGGPLLAPKLLILGDDTQFEGPLPGNYAFKQRVGNSEITLSFQTLAELREACREWMNELPPPEDFTGGD